MFSYKSIDEYVSHIVVQNIHMEITGVTLTLTWTNYSDPTIIKMPYNYYSLKGSVIYES
jgi:hypothetical protein